MKRNGWIFLLTGLAALTALACVTINVYFPEAAVKELASQIEDAVEQQAAEGSGDDAPQPEEEAFFSRSTLRGVLSFVFSAPKVYAQDGGSEVIAPQITNPAIRKIIANRASRADQIRQHKSSGVLGETKDALLEIRSRDALSLKDRASVQKLVKAENTDRETMFKEIAAATGTDLSQLPQIRQTYAETLRSKAKTGDWIQLPDDSWLQKE
ncbi:MAG: YdbL family protein [Deltaproteobacteria bacterium]|nr:YdbL family protein [Deltaproteobacteria bacterium]